MKIDNTNIHQRLSKLQRIIELIRFNSIKPISINKTRNRTKVLLELVILINQKLLLDNGKKGEISKVKSNNKLSSSIKFIKNRKY